ncbi:hypothetical protein [Streptomyces arenae]|uniref:hypothetical protein n=1 Tax=Streptomyces arenae TaxID=29301 RepID=UPI002659D0C5|nr:hypothetical protein [Streptomyces arenae]MCG7207391.1 hypothetical protein [Streptomyces arenae]
MDPHQRIGQYVARLETEAPLAALARGGERIELADTPHRHPNNTLRWWASPAPACSVGRLTRRRHQFHRNHFCGK